MLLVSDVMLQDLVLVAMLAALVGELTVLLFPVIMLDVVMLISAVLRSIVLLVADVELKT